MFGTQHQWTIRMTKRGDTELKKSSSTRFDISGDAVTPKALASLAEDHATLGLRWPSRTEAFLLLHKARVSEDTSAAAAYTPRIDPEDDLPPAEWRCSALNRDGHTCGRRNAHSILKCRSCQTERPGMEASNDNHQPPCNQTQTTPAAASSSSAEPR